jgi:hypothetical protein
MFHAVREDASQLKHVYRQLSDYSHFASLAVWNAHSIDDERERTVSWTDAPRWRDDKHRQVACAQAYELAVAGLDVLDRLGELLIPDGSDPHGAHQAKTEGVGDLSWVIRAREDPCDF